MKTVVLMAEAAKKSWQTRRRKKTGKSVAEHRKQLMLGAKDMLKEWSQNAEGKVVCVVCGDGVPKTILQEHHLNPDKKSEGKIWLCASCHNIFNKAKKTTQLIEVIRDLKLRRERLSLIASGKIRQTGKSRMRTL